MSGSTELLVLRLGLLALIFVFIGLVAYSMRGSIVSAPAARQSASRAWRLVVVRPGETGLARGAEFVLAGSMLIGRDARAGIVLADASVSTRHATVERVSGGWKVTDLGSTNGTLLEGTAVGERGAVARGKERLTVGSVVLQFASD